MEKQSRGHSDGTRTALRNAITVDGSRACVTAAAPVAASIGMSMLARGGNVYDAVVAAALAETVILPPKCGIAGDVIALVHSASDPGNPRTLISLGGAAPDLAAHAQQHGLSKRGPWSVGMPGAPAGYMELSRRGRLGLAEQAAGAIELARVGFRWMEVAAALTRRSQDALMEYNGADMIYTPGGQPVAAGTRVALPGLARVLEEFVARKEEVFAGPLGEAVIAKVAEQGRSLSTKDLLAPSAEWTTPHSTEIAGHRLWATASPTYGPFVLEAAAQAASAVDDPWSVPGAQGVLDAVEGTALRLAGSLHDDRNDGTSVVTAADSDGEIVVLVHSNSYQRYGSGLVVPEYGLVISNRAGRGFNADPEHPNFPRAGRRPATTLNAWGVQLPDLPDADGARSAAPRLLFGATPGGENQIRWNAQTLSQVLTGCVNPGELISAPRWGRFDDSFAVEAAHPLAEHWHLPAEMEVVPDFALRCSQQIVSMEPGTGLRAAADPRTGGAALGW